MWFDLAITIHSKIHSFASRFPNQILLDDLNELTSVDIEQFVSYLSFYEFNGKEVICNESAKSRKLSAVRSFFKYLFNYTISACENQGAQGVEKLKRIWYN